MPGYSYSGFPEYLPLKVGNSWTLSWIEISSGGKFKVTVTKDSVINSKKYYQCNFPGLSQWFRIDSLSGNIYNYSNGGGCAYSPGEILVDSIASNKNDSTNFCGNVKRKCVETGSIELFGNTYAKKEFGPVIVLTADSRKYAENIGIYFMELGDPLPTTYTLLGCVVNGIVYGDTTLTDINQISTKIPEKYSLSQNYPNPFNPKTVINYELRVTIDLVSIKVFDVLGNEVSTLVNEKQTAGSYSVTFDGINFPSGVYFYKLTAGYFIDTKRMVIVK